MSFQELFQKQKEFFQNGKTADIKFRKQQLQKLKDAVKKNEDKLYSAIYKDFGKSEFDTFSTEISFIYNEIDYYLKNLSSLAHPTDVSTNLVNLPGKSRIYYEPYGNTLVIGAWNYPFQLSIVPAISAIAAGNTVILKPSEIVENSAQAIQDLISSAFDESLFAVVQGGPEETGRLLELKFDKIFFTGSPAVGKIVYQAAAKNLTPVTLELGGKSPAIVTSNANLNVAAKRIVWGKFLNAGQTCIAPDYILADQLIKNELLSKIKEYIEKFDYSPKSENFTRIVNRKHFDRLTALIDPEKIYYGGHTDPEKLYIQPCVLDQVSFDDPVMQEEIFGPILPVIAYQDFDSALQSVKENEKPLSAYIFTESSFEKNKFLKEISFGGGCINDTLMHITNENLPFGGIGNSGFGSYHGQFGFESFSHRKSVIERAVWGEPNLKYPPYTDIKRKLIEKLL